MRELKRDRLGIGQRTEHYTEVLVASGGTATGLVVLWAVLGRKIIPASAAWVAIVGLAAFIVAATSLFLARIKGIALLWFFLFLAWCGFLFGAFQVSSGP
jgi:hypothetical protein